LEEVDITYGEQRLISVQLLTVEAWMELMVEKWSRCLHIGEVRTNTKVHGCKDGLKKYKRMVKNT
jgi:hypothetical protein